MTTKHIQHHDNQTPATLWQLNMFNTMTTKHIQHHDNTSNPMTTHPTPWQLNMFNPMTTKWFALQSNSYHSSRVGLIILDRYCPLTSHKAPSQDETRQATSMLLQPHTLSIAFWHLRPNSARTGYATEEALFISVWLSTDTVSALQTVWVLILVIRLWKQHSVQAPM